MNKTAELENQLQNLSNKLDRTDKKLKRRDCCTWSCINFILVFVIAISVYVMKDHLVEGDDSIENDA